jgi:hypothetical protein
MIKTLPMHLHPKVLAEASNRQASYFQERLQLEVPLRKFAFLVSVFAFSLLASFASAQQGDAYFGFGTLTSPGAASCNFNTGCPEKGGLYPNVGADVIFRHRIGFAYDVTWRGGQGLYGGTSGFPYRPIINTFSAIFEPRLGKKLSLDVLGGIGWQDTRVYSANYSCSYFSCTNYTSYNHFLVDVGGGLKYYFWNHAFIRPEVRYYNIINNTGNVGLSSFGYSSSSIVRVGGSIGYTIGPD